MWTVWVWTVEAEIVSAAATSRFVRPAASRRRTSSSRSVSPAGSGGSRAGGAPAASSTARMASRSSGTTSLLWLIALLAACAVAIERGIRFHRFAFVVYGVVYGYVGVTTRVLRPVLFRSETLVLAYFVLSGGAVVVALVLLARRFGRE